MRKSPINKQTIALQNKTSECGKLADFLTAFINSNDISGEIHNDLRLVLEEAFINVVTYAYSKEKNHSVTIEFIHSVNSISITFTDTGIAFNPLTDCDTSIETDDHCEGGMGIHIIKSLTDQQEYDRIEQRNVFTVTKHYTK